MPSKRRRRQGSTKAKCPSSRQSNYIGDEPQPCNDSPQQIAETSKLMESSLFFLKGLQNVYEGCDQGWPARHRDIDKAITSIFEQRRPWDLSKDVIQRLTPHHPRPWNELRKIWTERGICRRISRRPCIYDWNHVLICRLLEIEDEGQSHDNDVEFDYFRKDSSFLESSNNSTTSPPLSGHSEVHSSPSILSTISITETPETKPIIVPDSMQERVLLLLQKIARQRCSIELDNLATAYADEYGLPYVPVATTWFREIPGVEFTQQNEQHVLQLDSDKLDSEPMSSKNYKSELMGEVVNYDSIKSIPTETFFHCTNRNVNNNHSHTTQQLSIINNSTECKPSYGLADHERKNIVPPMKIPSEQFHHNTKDNVDNSCIYTDSPSPKQTKSNASNNEQQIEPKKALYAYYGQRYCLTLSKHQFYTFTTTENSRSPHRWTCIFTCPVTREKFCSAKLRYVPLGFYIEKESVIWYTKKKLAEDAAAARALDCMVWRDAHDYRFYCEDNLG